MVINVGRLRSGQYAYLADEIGAVAAAIAPAPLKVILEIFHLNDNEIKRGCEAAIKGGAAFVKTGTGWTPSTSTPARIRLITGFVGTAIRVKASGGIRGLAVVADMLGLGISRFGVNTASAVELLEACRRFPQGALTIPAREEVCARLDAGPGA